MLTAKKRVWLFLASVSFLLIFLSINCGNELPPEPQKVVRKPAKPAPGAAKKVVIMDEKPKFAASFPEEAYIELVANSDFLFEKHAGVQKKINEDLIKVANKYGYKIKDSDGMDELMQDLATQLDEIKNSDAKNGPKYEEAITDLIAKRLAELQQEEE